jgi:PTS system N-acetylglucosamine-specific IIC component
MAGFFPVMMFGLPAACLAMYHAAARERRAEVGGMLASMALTSFLTGVTEPVEFTFMFLAPALFAAHMVLTGLAFVVMNHLGVKLGFSFSAGLFDYLINFRISTRPWLLLPVGAVYFALYYGVFRAAIVVFDLKTPGRDDLAADAPADDGRPHAPPVGAAGRAEAFLAALGGPGNLESLDACTTRLRLIVRSQTAVDETALRRLGAKALVRPSERALQVILGPLADIIAGEIRAAVQRAGTPPTGAASAIDPAALVAALGGAGNLVQARAASTRLLITLRRPAPDLDRLARAAGVLATAGANGTSVHLIVGPTASDLAGALAPG